jgi:hypothetical protein
MQLMQELALQDWQLLINVVQVLQAPALLKYPKEQVVQNVLF